MGRRRASRELALKLLFQVDVGKVPVADALAYWEATAAEYAHYDPETTIFARELFEGTLAHLEEIDGIIGHYAREWSLDRMANVDRNLLRLAIYEILYRPDVPASVSVDEAVELAKKYSTAESGKFVNGILGSFLRELEAKPAAAPDR